MDTFLALDVVVREVGSAEVTQGASAWVIFAGHLEALVEMVD